MTFASRLPIHAQVKNLLYCDRNWLSASHLLVMTKHISPFKDYSMKTTMPDIQTEIKLGVFYAYWQTQLIKLLRLLLMKKIIFSYVMKCRGVAMTVFLPFRTKKHCLRHISYVLFMLPVLSFATNLTVTPTKVHISPKQKSGVLKIINKQDKAVKLQVFIKAWAQDESGNTQLSDSKNLVVFPKLLSIAAQSERPIRIGFQGELPATEQAFRVLIDELPDSAVKPGIAVVMPVRLSVPVFLQNTTEKSAAQLEIFQLKKQGKYLRVGVHNQGTEHVMLKQIEADLFQGQQSISQLSKAAWYVLPDAKIFFDIAWDSKLCTAANQAKIRLSWAQQSQVYDLALTEGTCQLPH